MVAKFHIASSTSQDVILSCAMSGESADIRSNPFYHHLTATKVFNDAKRVLKDFFGINPDLGELVCLKKHLVSILNQTISDHREFHIRRLSNEAIVSPTREAAFRLVQEFYIPSLSTSSFYSSDGVWTKYTDLVYPRFVFPETEVRQQEFKDYLAQIRFHAKNPTCQSEVDRVRLPKAI